MRSTLNRRLLDWLRLTGDNWEEFCSRKIRSSSTLNTQLAHTVLNPRVVCTCSHGWGRRGPFQAPPGGQAHSQGNAQVAIGGRSTMILLVTSSFLFPLFYCTPPFFLFLSLSSSFSSYTLPSFPSPFVSSLPPLPPSFHPTFRCGRQGKWDMKKQQSSSEE